MSKIVDMIGEKYGNLTVVRRGSKNPGSDSTPALWICVCDCGAERQADRKQLKKGHAATCGRGKCPFGIARRRHGIKGSKLNQPKARWRLQPDEVKVLLASECYYCGTKPAQGYDRRTWLQDYNIENALPCCAGCQAMKGKIGQRQFLRHIEKIAEKHGLGLQGPPSVRRAAPLTPSPLSDEERLPLD